jgi:5-methylcytosine-specific restriction protein A
MDFYFTPADPSHIKKERAKARELRASQWWRQQLGRGICHHCGESFSRDELSMDHLIPLARGGKTSKKNVVVSCKGCNSAKGYKTAVDQALEDLNRL